MEGVHKEPAAIAVGNSRHPPATHWYGRGNADSLHHQCAPAVRYPIPHVREDCRPDAIRAKVIDFGPTAVIVALLRQRVCWCRRYLPGMSSIFLKACSETE